MCPGCCLQLVTEGEPIPSPQTPRRQCLLGLCCGVLVTVCFLAAPACVCSVPWSFPSGLPLSLRPLVCGSLLLGEGKGFPGRPPRPQSMSTEPSAGRTTCRLFPSPGPTPPHPAAPTCAAHVSPFLPGGVSVLTVVPCWGAEDVGSLDPANPAQGRPFQTSAPRGGTHPPPLGGGTSGWSLCPSWALSQEHRSFPALW